MEKIIKFMTHNYYSPIDLFFAVFIGALAVNGPHWTYYTVGAIWFISYLAQQQVRKEFYKKEDKIKW